jgi:hypothetical protein
MSSFKLSATACHIGCSRTSRGSEAEPELATFSSAISQPVDAPNLAEKQITLKDVVIEYGKQKKDRKSKRDQKLKE